MRIIAVRDSHLGYRSRAFEHNWRTVRQLAAEVDADLTIHLGTSASMAPVIVWIWTMRTIARHRGADRRGILGGERNVWGLRYEGKLGFSSCAS